MMLVLFVAALADGRAPHEIAEGLHTLRRADDSVLHWSLDRRGTQGRQGVLVLAQGSGCLPAEKSAALRSAKSLLPEFAVLTVEKYGVSPDDAPTDPMGGCS